MERDDLFNFAKCLQVSSFPDQELVGYLPVELLFLLCKYLSCESCSLEFLLMVVRI